MAVQSLQKPCGITHRCQPRPIKHRYPVDDVEVGLIGFGDRIVEPFECQGGLFGLVEDRTGSADIGHREGIEPLDDFEQYIVLIGGEEVDRGDHDPLVPHQVDVGKHLRKVLVFCLLFVECLEHHPGREGEEHIRFGKTFLHILHQGVVHRLLDH